jgi:rsbT antagonist protein RsbS
MLSSIAGISKVLDAETVVVGMRPAVAITLVELGLYLENVRTALTVERAFAVIAERSAGAALITRLGDEDHELLAPDDAPP